MTPALEALPRFRLHELPSPLARLERLEHALGDRAELWIKREDLLPLAFGGNKLRNLEFLVGAALAEGADTLVTAGRRWSNHCRLTAAAGARAGLKVHVVLSGPAVEGAIGPRLDALLGATVHQLASADRDARTAALTRLVADLRAAGHRPYVIPVGGTGMPGVAGQVFAAGELLEQWQAAASGTPDALVLPVATGGTHAGILAGLRLLGSATEVEGVVVAHDAAGQRAAIRASLDALSPLTGQTVPDGDVRLDDRWLGGGYGRPTGSGAAAAELLARAEGILVDPIYTAKALAALVDGVRAGRWDGRRVVFWHAGGTPGLFEALGD